MPICHYEDYYTSQAGSGVGTIYRGSTFQRGHGFGTFLRGLFRSVMPLVKRGVKTIGREALKSGSYFISDVIDENKPIKEAFKSRVNETAQNLKRKADEKINSLVGSGVIKRQRLKNKNQNSSASRGVTKSKSTNKKKVKTSKSKDIFA